MPNPEVPVTVFAFLLRQVELHGADAGMLKASDYWKQAWELAGRTPPSEPFRMAALHDRLTRYQGPSA